MKNIALLVLSLCIAPLSVFAGDQKVRLPDNASLQWVSNNINQDGMQLEIQTFHTNESIEDVFNFYRETWFKEGEVPGFVENTLQEWSIISQLRDESNVVLQLKPDGDGGSEGFLSIAKKNSGTTQPAIDFPMPDGTEKFSSSYVEEDGTQVHTMTFISSQSVGNTVNFYRANMARKGWKLAKENKVEGNQIMQFNRNGDRCELVVSQFDSESTVIHVNRVKRNG